MSHLTKRNHLYCIQCGPYENKTTLKWLYKDLREI